MAFNLWFNTIFPQKHINLAPNQWTWSRPTILTTQIFFFYPQNSF
jgi:hypothetical protein